MNAHSNYIFPYSSIWEHYTVIAGGVARPVESYIKAVNSGPETIDLSSQWKIFITILKSCV